MATWKPPTAKSAGWSPRGGAWKRAGQQMQNFSAQAIAIMQWKAEEEAKRQQAEQRRIEKMQERAMDYVNALAKERQTHEDRLYQSERDKILHEYRMSEAKLGAWLKDKGVEQDDKIANLQARVDKEMVNLDKLQTDVGKRFGKILRDAYMSGDPAKVKQVYDNILGNQNLMRTYKEKTTTKEGEPTEVERPANDVNILLGVTQRILPVMTQLYGEPQKGKYGYPLNQREDLKKQLLKIQSLPDEVAAKKIQELIDGGIPFDVISEIINEISPE